MGKEFYFIFRVDHREFGDDFSAQEIDPTECGVCHTFLAHMGRREWADSSGINTRKADTDADADADGANCVPVVYNLMKPEVAV